MRLVEFRNELANLTFGMTYAKQRSYFKMNVAILAASPGLFLILSLDGSLWCLEMSWLI
jgi:hypothetical protein